MLNILSRQQQNPSINLRQVIPFEWYKSVQSRWQTILAHNPQLQDPKNLAIAESLNLDSYMYILDLQRSENIDAKEREAFIRLVGHKVNFLQIDNLILNPKLKTATKWKTVSLKFVELLKRKIGFNLSLPLLYLSDIKQKEDQFILINQNTEFKIIKLLVCSYTQNHLFYGYIDKKASTKQFIKEAIAFFEYFYTQDTKVTFLESNQFRNYRFEDCYEELQSKSELIMIHGLQRYDEKLYDQFSPKIDVQQFQIPVFESPRLTRISRNGEQLTMADQDSRTMSEHTMSTGAQTPFTFGIQDQDWDMLRPYRNYALFGEKLEEEIQHMKQYARQAIYTDIIEVPLCSQQLIMGELQKLAEDIQENIQKKKIYQKQIAKDTKQYYKELKETHHTLHFKDKEIFGKESKQFSHLRKVEGEKVKQTSQPIIYFSMGDLND